MSSYGAKCNNKKTKKNAILLLNPSSNFKRKTKMELSSNN